MNTTLPIKVIDLAQWKGTMDISDGSFHYVITGTNRNCGCINFLNEDESGEKVYYVTLRNCVWESKQWHSALGFIVRKGHGTLRAHLKVEGESTLIGSNFPGIDVNGSHVILDAVGKGAKLNLSSAKNHEGLRIDNGGKVELGKGTRAVEMAVGGETFSDFNAFLAAASQRKPVTLGLERTRIALLVNKAFEYEGFRRGVASVYAGKDFTGTLTLNEDAPKTGRPFRRPVATYEFANLDVDVYCIEYLFEKGENSSNSQTKFGHLTDLFRSIAKPDYVVSVSTSESTPDSQGGDDKSVNGCVYVGNHYFLSDQREADPESQSRLEVGKDGRAVYNDKLIHDELYGMIKAFEKNIIKGMNVVPSRPAPELRCLASDDYACVGVVNVMTYSRYEIADERAYEAYREQITTRMPIGIETTHGVVKMAVAKACGEDVPVMFVSPITDRYKKFAKDVLPDGEQNFACSYNGGVATANILSLLDKLLQAETKAVDFNGAASQAVRTIKGIGSYNFGTGPFTAEAWIKSTKGGTVISRKPKDSGLNNGGFLLVVKPDGVVKFATDDGFGFYEINSEKTNVLDGKPHHILGCRGKDGKLSITVDFSPVNVTERSDRGATTKNVDNPLAMSVGSTEQIQEDYNSFDGLIGECRVWNCAKTYSGKAEWKCIQHTDRSLVARWTFSNEDGSDSAFNPHNLDTENLAFGKFDI